MHVAISLFTIFAVWKWGDWRQWEKYHTTMLFIALGNLIYNFLTAGWFLWRLEADFLTNHSLTEMLYTIIVFPGSVLIFLSNFPTTTIRKVLHILTWIAIYVSVEWVFLFTKHISYQYGWNFWWSVLFNLVMFPILAVHHKRPLLAYLLSIPVIVFVLWYFEVPVHIPVEERGN